MKILRVKWQRLVYDGQTCPRCKATGDELEEAISTLKQILAPLGIKVVLEKYELSVEEFRMNPLESNRIWINGRPIEQWLYTRTGSSPCCGVCGPHDCRTLEVEGETHETITSKLIIKAGILAALSLVSNSRGEGDGMTKDGNP